MVILIYSLKIFKLFIVLYISFIFLLKSLKKFSLSLKISWTLKNETCIYYSSLKINKISLNITLPKLVFKMMNSLQ